MRVLITGGAGFIGSHLADAYGAAGYDVVVVDNLSAGRREYVPAGARLYETDIRSEGLRDVFVREQPEIVNHHAAQPSVTFSVQDPRHDGEVNVIGTINVLSLCAEFGVRRVVLASTAGAIYGEPQRALPIDEMHPIQPLAPYGISKYVGELYLRYFTVAGPSAAVLRYANVYGPRQDPYGEAGVIAIFSQAMAERRAPTIFGDGTQTRDFVYVEDVARANLLATESGTSNTANIATGIETTVNDLYREIARLTGFRSPPVYAPPRPGEVYRVALDATRARAWLGWMPEVPLDEGLRRTVEWFAQRVRDK